MSKKHPVTQELANIYPSWSRVRQDETSVGNRLLNSFGGPLDYMEKSLEKQKKNIYLTTANLDEIDITHKVLLPKEYEFDLDNTDPLEICPIPPTTSGLHLGEWHTISLAPNNNVLEFWYNSLPNRWSLTEVVSGVDDQLLTLMSEDAVVSGEWRHHLADTEHNGGVLWVEATGGTEYIRVTEDNVVERSRVRLKGRTRKGTIEEETLVFAWDSKQATKKEWEYLTTVNLFEMEDGVQVDIRSSDVAAGPYLDFWNTRFSPNRKKIDTFWDLEFIEGQPILSKIEYITDEWQQLMLGFSSKHTKERWELLDSDSLPVSGVDIAIQPFTDRAWLVTEDAKLYCYDLIDDMPSGIDKLQGATPGSHVTIEIEEPHVILGEDIEFIPWHARPLQEIATYKVWYVTPSGTKVNMSDVILAEGTDISRTIESYASFTPAERGTYILALEAKFADGTIHTYKTMAIVSSKKPLAEYDLGSLIPDVVEGIEFDSDNKLWLRTINNDFYHVTGHKDLMLIDYERKIMYFHEPYEEVDVGED